MKHYTKSIYLVNKYVKGPPQKKCKRKIDVIIELYNSTKWHQMVEKLIVLHDTCKMSKSNILMS